jgi:CHASE2 domain-containing sensor protein
MTSALTKGSTVRRTLMILLTASFTVLFDYLGLLEGINTYLYDMSFRLRGSRIPSEKITIAAIDERTLERLGRWPIRRVHYAGLLNRLREADVVAFDIIMTEHSEDDAVLTEEIRRYGRVVLPVYIDSRLEIRYPVQSFSPLRVGHIHVAKGIDGVVREVYHTLFHDSKELPSLSSVVYEAASGKLFHRSKPAPGQGSSQPILEMDGMRINYCGGPGVFERVSFSDILEGVYPSERFRNKIVLVGVTAPGLFEEAFIPFSEQRRGIPGVELQAHALNTLLAGTPIKVVSLPIRWSFVFILALLIFFYSMRALERNAALAAFLLLFALSIATYLLFAQFSLWLAPAIFYMVAILTFMMTYIFKFDEAIRGLDVAYARIHPN